MNTQTHILLATALLLPLTPVLMSHTAHTTANSAATRDTGQAVSNIGLLVTVSAVTGAILPDASLFLMFFIAKAQSVPDSIIWSEWYFSDTWQHIGAMTNSIPVYGFVALLMFALQRTCLFVVSFAALLHCLTDLPLHHGDGHPHFWPLSDWIYVSPVSYWDPNHYGSQWGLIELAIAAVLIAFLWRRSINRWSRGWLLLVVLSYLTVALFWITSTG